MYARVAGRYVEAAENGGELTPADYVAIAQAYSLCALAFAIMSKRSEG